jgi:hypothetical protein
MHKGGDLHCMIFQYIFAVILLFLIGYVLSGVFEELYKDK